jgi:hypothetical protein
VWQVEALPILASTKEGGAGASAIDSKIRGLFFINQKKKGFSFMRDFNIFMLCINVRRCIESAKN